MTTVTNSLNFSPIASPAKRGVRKVTLFGVPNLIAQILWRFSARSGRFRGGLPYRRTDRVRTLVHALRVRLWLQADIQSPKIDFCFTPNNGHSEAHAGLPVLTHSGSRGSPIRDTVYRRLQPFRHLHDCSGCFRLERWPVGTCTHWKSAALPGRTPQADVGPIKLSA